MLTTDKKITTRDYWDKVYSGDNMDAKVDSSNTIRPPSPFDRFDIVVNQAFGKRILGIGSGHAHIEKRLKAKYPESEIIASDQSLEAMKVSKYEPYQIMSGYDLVKGGPAKFTDKYFDMVIACQCLEYFDDIDRLMTGIKRVSKYFLCTVPKGEMSTWSQLRIYDVNNFTAFMNKWGAIEVLEDREDGKLLLGRIKF